MARSKTFRIKRPAFTVDHEGNGSQGEISLTVNDDGTFTIEPVWKYLLDFYVPPYPGKALHGPYKSAQEAVEAYETVCNDYQAHQLSVAATTPMIYMAFGGTATGLDSTQFDASIAVVGPKRVMTNPAVSGVVYDPTTKARIIRPVVGRTLLLLDTDDNMQAATMLAESIHKAADAIGGMFEADDPVAYMKSLVGYVPPTETALRGLIDSNDGQSTAMPLTAGVSAEEKTAVLEPPPPPPPADDDEL